MRVERLVDIIESDFYTGRAKQYFVGLPGFQNESPFVPSLLAESRKRLNDEIMIGINEMIIAYNESDVLNGAIERYRATEIYWWLNEQTLNILISV